MKRKVAYITGTRADFGLMQNALQAIHCHPQLSLALIVTGMHLLPLYGDTLKDIVASGLPVAAKVPVSLSGAGGAEMAAALGNQVVGFTRALQHEAPDLVVLLGDRGEMLAGAIAALHLNIPIVHIHGGELSGTVDESIRHAVSKLAHYHFTSTEASRDRLIRMGEQRDKVFVTGAPGLDEIVAMELRPRAGLFSEYGLDPNLPLMMILFHPVVQQAEVAAQQAQTVFDAVKGYAEQALVVMPNADAGGAAIAAVIDQYTGDQRFIKAIHVPRSDFLSLLKESEMMIGNSSSGIIEAASLGTPVINIGDRQRCRERNENVIDVSVAVGEIAAAVDRVRRQGRYTGGNVYGDGQAAERIVELLATVSLDAQILEKVNAY